MSHARFIVGDVFDVLATIPDGSVDLVLTSPPFLALRSYLPADHPDKGKEIGAEPTPADFIDTLIELTEEWERVLAPHGSICVELGDTYSGSGGGGGDYLPGGMREGQQQFAGAAASMRESNAAHWRQKNAYKNRDDYPRGKRTGRTGRNDRPADVAAGITQDRRRPGPEGRDANPGWPLDKSLCLVPELFRVALVYGFNPLTGRETPRWRARNVIRWCRPNPPVGALGDKVRPATSDMVVACKDRRRFFDLDAVRTAHSREHFGNTTSDKSKRVTGSRVDDGKQYYTDSHPAGAPPLDHWWFDDEFDQDAWLVSTQPYKGSHYATWPEDLIIKPIEAMCPKRVCLECGKPSERITERTERYAAARAAIGDFNQRGRDGDGVSGSRSVLNAAAGADITSAETVTIGWTDCGHDSWRTGVVLDPFAGSGTTLAVAVGHGRDAIGVDIDARNADLATERVGMFLTVEACGQREVPA